MTEQAAPRIDWIDFAKGVAIILMVLGHAIDGMNPLCKFIYVFHMPFFFVTAGFLLNLNKWGGVYKSFEMKLVKRLLLPYYLAEFLWYPFHMAKEIYFGHLLKIIFYRPPLESFLGIFIGKTWMMPLAPLWFLPCLLVAEIIFVRLYNRFGKNIFLFAVVILLSTYAGFELNRFGYLPLGFNVALVSQIFLSAGILIRKYKVVERLTPIICGVLTLSVIFAFYINERVEMSGAIYGNPILFYMGGLAGTVLLMKISELMTRGKIFSLISSCGRQSMMILVLHPIIIEFVYNLFVRNDFFTLDEMYTTPPIILAVTMTGTLIPLFIARRFGKLPVLRVFCA